MAETQASSNKTATVLAALIVLAALLLVIDRGGVLAWATLVLGGALLAKTQLKPSQKDWKLGIGLVVGSALAWFGTQQYVISTWESGEVVELAIDTADGTQTVRLWVLEVGPDPVIYYDATPAAAASLQAGNPVQFTRAGVTSTRIPVARLVEEIPEAQANEILGAMEKKYGERNNAAIIYYLMLGRASDRVSLVATLTEA